MATNPILAGPNPLEDWRNCTCSVIASVKGDWTYFTSAWTLPKGQCMYWWLTLPGKEGASGWGMLNLYIPEYY